MSTSAPVRQPSDLLAEMQFLETQLQVIQETAGPHHLRNIGLRIAALHRRLDALERQLRRQARAAGEDDRATIAELRRRLALRAAEDEGLAPS